jgi:hypothetical protein
MTDNVANASGAEENAPIVTLALGTAGLIGAFTLLALWGLQHLCGWPISWPALYGAGMASVIGGLITTFGMWAVHAQSRDEYCGPKWDPTQNAQLVASPARRLTARGATAKLNVY